MREIKFRAWDEELNQMYCGDQIEGESNLNVWLSYGDLAIYRIDDGDYTELKPLQWTGLVDKNGVEIYEGDLLEIDSVLSARNILGPFPVTFEYYQWLADEFSFGELVELTKKGDLSFEVIGNIYENPELLEVRP